VFWRGAEDGPWTVYGCLKRRKHPVRIGSGSFDQGDAPGGDSFYRAWSPFLAVDLPPCDRYGDNCVISARTVDLRTGRVRAGGFLNDHFRIHFEISSAGTIGGIGARAFSRGEYIAYRVTRRGLEVLDRSRAIDPHSLRLIGTTMYWTNGGTTSSAELTD
jgi:hypothetical protein